MTKIKCEISLSSSVVPSLLYRPQVTIRLHHLPHGRVPRLPQATGWRTPPAPSVLHRKSYQRRARPQAFRDTGTGVRRPTGAPRARTRRAATRTGARGGRRAHPTISAPRRHQVITTCQSSRVAPNQPLSNGRRADKGRAPTRRVWAN